MIRSPTPIHPLSSPILAFSKRSRSSRPHRLPSSPSVSCGGLKVKLPPGPGPSLPASKLRIFLQQSPKPNPFPASHRLLLTVVSISPRSRTSLSYYRRFLRRWMTIRSRISSTLSRTSTWTKASVHSLLRCCTKLLLGLSLRQRFLRRRLVYLHQKRRASTPPTAISHLRSHWEISPQVPLQPLWQG